jgi:hypothetical protein
MIRPLAIVLVASWFLLASLPALAQSGGAGASHCQAVYNEIWELRAKGKDGEANNLNGRLRHLGCFEPPISNSLCPILEQQGLLRASEGNNALTNVIHAQQRRFLCL